MLLPPLNEHGDLPPGIHRATLDEIAARFGTGNARRRILSARLERIYRIATETGHLRRFIVFGSFITAKPEPNDVDVFLMMEDSFDYSLLKGESLLLFDHNTAQDHFGGSIFWVRRMAAFEGEEATVAHWQFKRDSGLRGIVEVVAEAK